MPAAILQLLATVLKEEEIEVIREEATPLFLHHTLAYMFVCPLEQGEKRSFLYPGDMRQKSSSLASNSKMINCNLQRLHPCGLKMRPSHRTCEMLRKEDTKSMCLGAAGQG